MKQQPDKFFQEKLDGYTRPAPAMAWDKIESQLDKKNNKGIWLRIAAAVLVLTISIPVIYTLLHKESTREISRVINDVPQVAHTAPVDEKIAVESVKAPEIKSEVQQKQKANAADKNHPVLEVKAEQQIAEVTHAQSTSAEPSEVVVENPVVETENDIAYHDFPAQKNNELIDRNIKLVISAEETTSYFEGEENLLTAEATSKEKKTSTFRKLLRKASDLKTNQDPFGELRQKKNEILALNFKSDKKRSQKTN